MVILGIETSCDETAAALVDGEGKILSNMVLSQLDDHRIFGGVVPEIAARAHMDHLDRLIKGAMDEAGLKFSDLSGIAATCGPGLIGGVMVGMMAGKAIAAAAQKPFIAINHLEAHALTPRLTDRDLQFPYLLLLVSGGHTQLLVVEDVGVYHRLGTTLDDALGECFDKAAKLMGLPYPGGPNLERAANQCTDADAAAKRFDLPRPMMHRPGCDFSFSGLKTAVRHHVDALPPGALNMDDVAAIAASFQISVRDVVTDRCKRAMDDFSTRYPNHTTPTIVVAGGVAANMAVRGALEDLARAKKFTFIAPPLNLCSDNGAMIAWAGVERLRRGDQSPLDFAARPRWPLDPDAAPKHGAGIKA